MTTVAYRDGVMAGDTLVTEGDIKLQKGERKVHRFKDGRLFGGAGSYEGIERLMTLTRDNEKLPKLGGVFAILVDPDGTQYVWQVNRWMIDKEPFLSVGSGSSVALGAMAAGASAKEAVSIARRFDKDTGGRVQTVSIYSTGVRTRSSARKPVGDSDERKKPIDDRAFRSAEINRAADTGSSGTAGEDRGEDRAPPREGEA